MRYVFPLLLMLMFFDSRAQKMIKKDSLISITYESFGQVGKANMIIDNKKVEYKRYCHDNFPCSICLIAEMNPNKWEELKKIILDMDLSKLASFKSPTSYRDVDGAWYVKLIITTNRNSYSTQDFDSGHPMKEIEPIIKVMEELLRISL